MRTLLIVAAGLLGAAPAVAHTVMIGAREFEFTSVGFHQTDVGEVEEFRVHLMSSGSSHAGDYIACERGGYEVNCATGEEP
jgi:hypothetical protein